MSGDLEESRGWINDMVDLVQSALKVGYRCVGAGCISFSWGVIGLTVLVCQLAKSALVMASIVVSCVVWQ